MQQEVKTMKKMILLVIVFTFYHQQAVYACSCFSQYPIGTEIKETDFIFLGQCIGSEFIIGKKANAERGYAVRYFFKVQESFKGISKNKITVETGIGFGDCGFNFRPGATYLVYAYMNRGKPSTGICSRTKLAGFFPDRLREEVKSELDEIKQYIK